VVGSELLKEMEEQMLKIKKNLKAAQDRHKSYDDKNITRKEFKVEDNVFLRVKDTRKLPEVGKLFKGCNLDIVGRLKS
jgi:hypothetical protein